MALINLKIFGIKINDTLSFKIIVGGICIGLLLILLGPSNFYEWTITSLTTYVATILIVLSITNFFIDGELSTRDLIMVTAGTILLLVACAKNYNSLMEMGISIIKAFVWATIFSIFIEMGKKHMNRMEHSMRKFVQPKMYDHRRQVSIDDYNGRTYRDKWDGIIKTHGSAETEKVERISRKPYIK